jgi:heme A synthase
MYHLVGSIFWIIIGIGVTINAYKLGLGRLNEPGPGFIFFIASSLLVILGVIDLTVTLMGSAKTEKEKEPVKFGVRWPKVLFILVALTVYVYFFSILGFFLSTFLLLLFLFKALEPTKWWIAIVASVITILISYGIFKICLMVPFPKGVLGF